MDTKKIGIFLKELRKEKGLTQEQLAEKLLVSIMVQLSRQKSEIFIMN